MTTRLRRIRAPLLLRWPTRQSVAVLLILLLLGSVARGCDQPPSSSSVLEGEEENVSSRILGGIVHPDFCALELGFRCNWTTVLLNCTTTCNHTCDGPSGTAPVCKLCKGIGKQCKRTSQCCRGGTSIPLSCQNNFCWPERFFCPARPPLPIIANLTKSSMELETTVKSGSLCQSRADCCGGSTGQFQLTCDGTTTSNRRCVVCKASRQGPCTRSTQCCRGLKCKNRRCSS